MSSVASTSSSVNGHTSHVNGSAVHGDVSVESSFDANGLSSPSSSSYPLNGFLQPPYQNIHNEEIVSHLYHSGFQTGNYADTILHVNQNVYRLHAIILSRSPFLAHLMSSLQSTAQRVIFVDIDREPEVTQEGFAIALGYLYSTISLNLVRPENARPVLAAGCLLGGMDDLCQYSYGVCRQSMSVETIGSWLEFSETIPCSPDGSISPDMTSTVFGQFAQRLRDDVFHFLVVTLPEVLEVTRSHQDPLINSAGRDTLLQIYARVPFEMFKSAVESPTFTIGTDQARFKFAKDAIELRKRGIARGAEETVVLAFGQGNFGNSAVHVTRKMRKRPLWKVNS